MRLLNIGTLNNLGFPQLLRRMPSSLINPGLITRFVPSVAQTFDCNRTFGPPRFILTCASSLHWSDFIRARTTYHSSANPVNPLQFNLNTILTQFMIHCSSI